MMKPKTHDQMQGDVEGRERYEHDLSGDRGSSRRQVASYSHGATVENEEHWEMSRRIVGVRFAMVDGER